MEDDKVAKPVVGDVPMEEGGKDVKEAKKKEKKENPKNAKKAERQLARQMEAAAVQEVVDPLAANYGEVELVTLQSATQSGRKWIKVSQLDQELKGQTVLVRGRVHAVRGKGKMAFLVVRESGYTVQCLASIAENIVSKQMLKFISGLNKESIIDVEGEVSVPPGEIAGTSQQVEIQIRKLFCVSKALPSLPLTLEDASRSELDFEKAEKEGKQYVKVGQDTRLNNRVLDLRTPCNQAVFRVQSHVSMLFREYLVSEDFVEVHTPKLMAGASEGGSSVFTLDYKGQPACLAQSPQLHKQMGICADFGRVFEIGPVFRAENSFTHRHLCEFTGLDLEMEIKEHYFEVIDLLDKLFVHIFDGLNSKCKKELEAINQQYPFEPLKYHRETLRLTFDEGVQMLKEAGTIVDPMGDLNTESEKKLGQLVKDKYDTDFYILHRYPLAVRPFYTMPCADDPRYTNSFDVFIRGEEIISGAQRVHDVDLLTKRAIECGIDVKSLSTYIDSFRYGVVPHGGLGVGLERVVMLFCALGNIRKTSMFPRDPQRLAP
ncbi:aspartyl-tRNA synthetase [Marchantia polymorpha subsp. ruderalis]|uniref:aspartate--tRNA ligase n=2 Tax=Marchantia polymorpha TaxID=3197 RepID=A0AAF6B867_MARPO|nr:hypothetical protein MARPO_0132s0010 [Marchantia polymorpha]BBN08201.1 hypothetical protein Mp_4g09670 [Marchantia polymorpha subsp. ruderalis]|eukprot:PTQ29931.1 hypothetical protein MARPO_0132s0010 [Marchantia polymorpha]